MNLHPQHREIENRGNGPAKVEYPDGSEDLTESLAYTTAIYYTTLDGTPVTTKGSAIKRIVWLSPAELREQNE